MIRILKYSEIQQEELTKPRGSHADVSGTVSEILETVRREGDAALLRYTERFDHVRLADLAVSREEYEEGLAGVDPAARDYILRTIINNYREDALVIISTHLIADVESVLDEAVFLKQGEIVLHQSTDELREQTGKSVDEYFREVFRC